MPALASVGLFAVHLSKTTPPSAGSQAGLFTYIQGLRARKLSKKIEVADTYAAYRDVSLATGAVTTSLQRGDGLHPNFTGARRIGSCFGVAAGLNSPVDRFVDLGMGGQDVYSLNSASKGVVVNPTFLGTGGTNGGAGIVSGNIPTSWQLAPSTGLTTTTSIATDLLPRQRNWLQQIITGTLAASGGVTLLQFTAMSAINLNIGDQVMLRFAVQATGLSANFASITGNANFFTAGFVAAGGAQIGGGNYGNGELASGQTLIFETPIAVAAAGATQVQIAVSIAFNAGACTGTVKISDVTAYKLN